MKKKTKKIDRCKQLMKKWSKTLGWKKSPVKFVVKDYKPTIELASQEKIKKQRTYMHKIATALGHPEALITDESIVADFLDIFDKEERIKQVKKAQKKLKVDLFPGDYLWEVAERMKK